MNKKLLNLITIAFVSIPFFANAQFGIMTNAPKATLDVDTNNLINVADGIKIPHITGNELKSKDAVYNVNTIGCLIYVTEPANPTSIKTQNINSKGIYFFDGNIWNKLLLQQNNTVVNVNGLNANLTSPNDFIGATFTPSLPQSNDCLYINTADNSTWIYSKNQYISYTNNESSWYINNTNIDAGTDKNSDIYRNANIGIATINPTEKIHVTGNLKFNGKLLPNGASGNETEVLVSNGANTAPLWQPNAQPNPNASIDLKFAVGYYEINSNLTLPTPNVNNNGRLLILKNTSNATITISVPTGVSFYNRNTTASSSSRTLVSGAVIQLQVNFSGGLFYKVKSEIF